MQQKVAFETAKGDDIRCEPNFQAKEPLSDSNLAAQVLGVDFSGNRWVIRARNNRTRIRKDRNRDVVCEKTKHKLVLFDLAQSLQSIGEII